MVHLHLDATSFNALRAHLQANDILAPRPRWVFHLDISSDDVDTIVSAIASF
jgi:hypothetical protein